MLSPLGNIHDTPIREILMNDKSRDVRQAIINGQWHPDCFNCKNSEEKGSSMGERTATISNIDLYRSATENDFKLTRIDIRWSNTCNLMCVYCFPLFSSRWAAAQGKVNKLDKEQKDNFLQYLKENAADITDVLILGGEPLLEKNNIALAQLLKEGNNNPKVYMFTNGAIDVTDNAVFDALLEIKVGIAVSFETVGERFEFVRHGAKWNSFVTNLRTIHSKIKATSGCPDVLQIQCTYSIYSAFNLCEFYEFVEAEGYFASPRWQLLTSPLGFSVYELSPKLKAKAIDELNNCIDTYGDRFDMSELLSIRAVLREQLTDGSMLSFDDDIKYLNIYIDGKGAEFKRLWPNFYD